MGPGKENRPYRKQDQPAVVLGREGPERKNHLPATPRSRSRGLIYLGSLGFEDGLSACRRNRLQHDLTGDSRVISSGSTPGSTIETGWSRGILNSKRSRAPVKRKVPNEHSIARVVQRS